MPRLLKRTYKIKVTSARNGSFEGYINDKRSRLDGTDVIGSYEATANGYEWDSGITVEAGDISFLLKDGGYSKAQLDSRFDTDDIAEQIEGIIDHIDVIQDARDAAGDAAYEAYRDDQMEGA